MPFDPHDGAAPRQPQTGADLVARARPRNRLLALGVVAVVFTVFASAVLIGVWSQLLK